MIREIVEHEPRKAPVKPVDSALGAMESLAPTATQRLRRALDDVLLRLDAMEPDWNANRGKEEQLIAHGVGAALPLAIDVARLSEACAAAIGEKPELGQPFARFFGEIASRYDFRHAGQMHKAIDFDLHKFLGHEVFTGFIALLLREQRWTPLGDILGRRLVINGWQKAVDESFCALSDYASLLDDRKAISRFSLLEDRHKTGALAELVPWDAFVDADYLLFLRGMVHREEGESRIPWRPWSWPALFRRTPDFLRDAESLSVAEGLAQALGVGSVLVMRAMLSERGRGLGRLGGPGGRSHLDQFDFNRLGTR